MEVNDAIILKKMRKEEKKDFFRAASDDLDSDNDEECISGMATNTILLFHGHLHDWLASWSGFSLILKKLDHVLD